MPDANKEYIISADKFILYADYFSMSADAGVARAKVFFGGINPVVNVDMRTYDVFDDAQQSKRGLIATLQLSYNVLLTEAESIVPMSDAFKSLAEHIRKWTGSNLNDYLSNNNIQVSSTYANISSLCNNSINNENIES